jgi:tetratricopeptide (TPR) repeat protein
MKLRLAILLFAFTARLHGMERLDSLLQALASQPADTNKVNTLNELSKEFRNIQPDSALLFANQGLALSVRLGFMHGMAKSSHNAGAACYVQGQYTQALAHFNRAMVAWRLVFPPSGGARGATTLGNIALVYSDLGDYPRALEQFLQVLAISEKTGEKQLYTSTLANVGLIYFYQKNDAVALEYYRKALAANERYLETGDEPTMRAARRRIAVVTGNIGNVFYERGQLDSAYANYLRSLLMRRELRMKNLEANTLSNLGTVCLNKLATAGPAARDTLLARAEEYFTGAHAIYESMGDRGGLAGNHLDLGNLYLNKKDYANARRHYETGLEEARSIGVKLSIMSAYAGLARLDSVTGDHKNSLRHFKLHIQYSDSLNNEQNTRKTVQAEMQYEFDKREAAGRLEQEKRDAVAAAEAKRQRMVLYAISGFGLLILGFGIFAWRSFLQKRRANIEIGKQKAIIEEKQKEIIDSIHYARRIQRSLLPQESYIYRTMQRLHGVR